MAGSAVAATLTTIFAPTHVAPLPLSQSDLRAIAAITGLGNGQALGAFSTPDGSSTLRFGTITWSSGVAHPVSSLADAAAEAGFPVKVSAHLPAGVGAVQQLTVQPRVRAVLTFNSDAADLAGSSVTLVPVPVPSGASVRSVQVAGSPGVLLADASNAVSAVVWEDGSGLLHAVAGILDSRDVLNVGDQLG